MIFYNNGIIKKIRLNNVIVIINNGKNYITGHDDVIKNLITNDPDLSFEEPKPEKKHDPVQKKIEKKPELVNKEKEVKPVSKKEKNK